MTREKGNAGCVTPRPGAGRAGAGVLFQISRAESQLASHAGLVTWSRAQVPHALLGAGDSRLLHGIGLRLKLLSQTGRSWRFYKVGQVVVLTDGETLQALQAARHCKALRGSGAVR